MTARSKATNKANFETGDIPTEAQFTDLIDSYTDYSAHLDAVAALTPTDGNVIVGNGTTWVAESGAAARTSLGLGASDSPQFTGVNIGHASDTPLTRASAGVLAIDGVNVLTTSAAQTISNKEISGANNTITDLAIGVEVSNTISTDLLPSINSAYDLGAVTFAWAKGHFDQIVVGGTIIDGTILPEPTFSGISFWDDIINEEIWATLGTGLVFNSGSGTLSVHAALQDLTSKWVPASASGATSMAFAEDTDNGLSKATVQGPAALGSDVTLTLPDVTGTLLATADPATLTAGFNAIDYDAGTKLTGTFTPDPANGNFQKYVNGGAHTLAPPGSSCCIVIQMTNNSSAGAVTTSGFTMVTGTGFTTTNGHDFLCHITRCNSFSHLHVTALQ